MKKLMLIIAVLINASIVLASPPCMTNQTVYLIDGVRCDADPANYVQAQGSLLYTDGAFTHPDPYTWNGPGAFGSAYSCTNNSGGAIYDIYLPDYVPPGGVVPLPCCQNKQRIVGVMGWTRACATNSYGSAVIRMPASQTQERVMIINTGGEGCSCAVAYCLINSHGCEPQMRMSLVDEFGEPDFEAIDDAEPLPNDVIESDHPLTPDEIIQEQLYRDQLYLASVRQR